MRCGSQGKYLFILGKHNHPMADKLGRILLHRYIMSKHLRRYLLQGEVVHHIDGNARNNHIKNLKLLSNSEHSKLHSKKGRTTIELICPSCFSIFIKEKRLIKCLNPCCSRSCATKQAHIKKPFEKNRQINYHGTSTGYNLKKCRCQQCKAYKARVYKKNKK